jgi:isocitrate/isopropylmalate dehydrogenase
VAGATGQALHGVKAELDLVTRVTRVLTVDGEALTTFAPLDDDAAEWTLERAFASARERSGRLVSVGVNGTWRSRVDRHAERHEGVGVTHLPLADALHALARDPGSLGLVVVECVLADAVMEAPRLADRRRLAATALLSQTGPGVFAPTHGAAHDIAGQGVANPSEMLVAAALLLDEGLERRAAAQALEESLGAALRSPHRPADMTSDGVAATTREFVDAVLGLLPSARRDTEFALAVTR